MKKVLMKIFIINFPQGNQKPMLLLKRYFLRILEEHAPLKKKLLRTNHAPCVRKALRKAIVRGSY